MIRSASKGTIYALATLCCLLWAGAYVTGKIAISGPHGGDGFGPFRAAFFRFALAGLLLGGWHLWRSPRALRIERKDWPAFIRLAVLGMGLTYTFNYGGLALSTGTAAALIMATEPVWIAVLAVLFLHEKMTHARGAGIVSGLAGAVLVVLSTQKPDASGGSGGSGNLALLGNVLMVLSLLWEAGAVLTAKRLMEKYPPVVVLTLEFVIGALTLAPFALWETLQNPDPLHPHPAAWAAFWYLLVGCTLVAYTVWFQLLAVTDASDITVFIFLQPVVGTLIGVWWLHDPFGWRTFLGAVLVLVALLCIMRQNKSTVPSAAAESDFNDPAVFSP